MENLGYFLCLQLDTLLPIHTHVDSQMETGGLFSVLNEANSGKVFTVNLLVWLSTFLGGFRRSLNIQKMFFLNISLSLPLSLVTSEKVT